jgi:hypothetical protein
MDVCAWEREFWFRIIVEKLGYEIEGFL